MLQRLELPLGLQHSRLSAVEILIGELLSADAFPSQHLQLLPGSFGHRVPLYILHSAHFKALHTHDLAGKFGHNFLL